MEAYEGNFWDRFSFRRRNRARRKEAQVSETGDRILYGRALSSFLGHGKILLNGEICEAFCESCYIFKDEEVKVLKRHLFFYVVQPAEWENGYISLDRTPPAT